MDDNQTPRPEGDIKRGQGNKQNIKLFFKACQRRMCFHVTLKDGVSVPTQGQRFPVRIVRTSDQSIAQSPVEGFIVTG